MAMAIAQAPAQGISFADTNPTIGVVSGEVVVTRVPGLVRRATCELSTYER